MTGWEYTAGVAALAGVVAGAAVGGLALRRALLPGWRGAPALLVVVVAALATVTLAGQLAGLAGGFERGWLIVAVWALAALSLLAGRRISAPARMPVAPPSRGGPIALAAAWVAGVGVAAVWLVWAWPALGEGPMIYDSQWYHLPIAAEIAQSGAIADLHITAPRNLTWLYPLGSEQLHASGMVLTGRDLLTPLLNFGWLAVALVASWCVGRPTGTGPLTLLAGCVVLATPVFDTQPGEARNDVMALALFIAAAAIAINAASASKGGPAPSRRTRWREAPAASIHAGALVPIGLALGLAAGARLNLLPGCGALLLALAVAAPVGARTRQLLVPALAAGAVSGVWYLRNLIATGSPLPFFERLGPVELPGPEQGLGLPGKVGSSVADYATDLDVWGDYFLPGLAESFTFVWPLLLAGAAAGAWLALARPSSRLHAALGGVVAVSALAYVVTPVGAAGPPGEPDSFAGNLRYLTPALVLGLQLVAISPLASRVAEALPGAARRVEVPARRLAPAAIAGILVLLAVAGYAWQRELYEQRAVPPAAGGWLSSDRPVAVAVGELEGARVVTNETRGYPLYGLELENEVTWAGTRQPRGGWIEIDERALWLELERDFAPDRVLARRGSPLHRFLRAEPGWSTAARGERVELFRAGVG